MNAYYQIFADVPDTDYESAVAWLQKELGYSLTTAYEELFEDADVRHFNDTLKRFYTIFFDCTQDFSDDIYGRASRVVFVYGRSTPGAAKRNQTRMGQFLGQFKNQPEYVGYDKGILSRIAMTVRSIKIFIRSLENWTGACRCKGNYSGQWSGTFKKMKVFFILWGQFIMTWSGYQKK